MKKYALVILSLLLAVMAGAQGVREEIASDPWKAAGLHYSYPGPQSVQTKAPRGYKPFYISHFGRHGSRWHINPNNYAAPVATLSKADSAGVLSPLGKEVLAKAEALAEDGRDRLGELTPLGMQQHSEVAARMYKNFKSAFKGKAVVTANSTLSPRVMISMFYFCNTLKGLNPKIKLFVNSSRRDSRFVSNRENTGVPAPYTVSEEKAKLKAELLKPQRLMGTLFTDEKYVEKNIDQVQLMWQLYYLTVMVQNCGMESESFLDIFTADELYDCWRVENYDIYLFAAEPWNRDNVSVPSCKPMISHIIEKADEALSKGQRGATLRFSHDSYLVPMAVCLGLEGCTLTSEDPKDCGSVFADYKISPMCGNIQIVFFKNRKGSVLVKFLLNENEVTIPLESKTAPYYPWEEVKAYYKEKYNI